MVFQHVLQRVAHLTQRSQDAVLNALRKHAASARPQLVQRASDTTIETLHASRERPAIIRFDDQMQMVRLDRVVDDVKGRALRRANAARDHVALAQLAQSRQAFDQLERHEPRIMPRNRLARSMRHAALPLTLRILATPTPPRLLREVQLGLRRAVHS